jgi:hypothetical protein
MPTINNSISIRAPFEISKSTTPSRFPCWGIWLRKSCSSATNERSSCRWKTLGTDWSFRAGSAGLHTHSTRVDRDECDRHPSRSFG